MENNEEEDSYIDLNSMSFGPFVHKTISNFRLFDRIHKIAYILDIRDDVTTKELSDIMIILFLAVNTHDHYDWGHILVEKKIIRHFKIKKESS